MTRLSVAMIVRDEEEMLPGCLASLRECELVAVDTGSRDSTRELLRAAGAKVFDFPWNDDFAQARNFALSHCTGEWVLVLDADERVTPELWAQLLALPETAGAATVVMRNVQAHGHMREARLLRVFRNHPSIRYRYPIHEDATESVCAYLRDQGKAMLQLEGVIEHLGYTRAHALKRGKRERDQRLLEKHLAGEPHSLYSHFKLLELARFWGDGALLRSAAERVQPLLATELSRDAPWAGELVVLVASALWTQSPHQALEFVESFSGQLTPSAAWHLRRGELHELLGNRELARASFAACLGMRSALGDLQLSTVRPLMGLCRLAMAEGLFEEAREWVHRALALGPDDPEAKLAWEFLKHRTAA